MAMLEKFLNSFSEIIISQFKLPRKGAAMILFVLTSLTIALNKWAFNYSIIPHNSILLQILYALWLFSVYSIPIKIYNQYCDKKDIEKQKLELNQTTKDKNEKYIKFFDTCDYEEIKIFEKFYYHQKTSIDIGMEEIDIINGLRIKNFEFISATGISGRLAGKAYISINGLNLIKKYFNRDKPNFFDILNSLDEKELMLFKDFVNNNDKQIRLYKKEIKIANSIINKFAGTKFNSFYIDTEGFFTISTLYLAYLTQYFSE